MDTKSALVIGTGAWGTTFAKMLAEGTQTAKESSAGPMDVTMWGRSPITVGFINDHENSAYLPGIALPPNIAATTDLAAALATGPELVALAVPTYAVAEVVSAANLGELGVPIVSLTKGIAENSGRTMAEIIEEVGKVPAGHIAVIAGPNLSREIAQGQPSAACVASTDLATAQTVAGLMRTDYFQLYPSVDVVGVEIAGAVKNVIAIAVGAAEGMGFGANSKAILMTRGLDEMIRLGQALGAQLATFTGPAGIGDLMTTCSTRLSRNYSLGYHLGRGRTLEESLARLPGVAEGVTSALPVLQLGEKMRVEMPITEAVAQVVQGEIPVERMGEMLLGRPPQAGWEAPFVD